MKTFKFLEPIMITNDVTFRQANPRLHLTKNA